MAGVLGFSRKMDRMNKYKIIFIYIYIDGYIYIYNYIYLFNLLQQLTGCGPDSPTTAISGE